MQLQDFDADEVSDKARSTRTKKCNSDNPMTLCMGSRCKPDVLDGSFQESGAPIWTQQRIALSL